MSRLLLVIIAIALNGAVRAQNQIDADTITDQATILYDKGNLTDALPLFEQAAKLNESKYGFIHEKTGTSLANLATIYQELGNYEKALELNKRLVELARNLLGPENARTALCMIDEAKICMLLNKFQDALLLHKKAAEIIEKANGLNDNDTALSKAELADIYLEIGEYENALPLILQALSIWGNNLSEDDTTIPAVFVNLGYTYQCIGDYENSLIAYNRALEIYTRISGSNSPEAANCIKDIGNVYMGLGEHAKALHMFDKALGIIKSTVGVETSEYADALNDLGLFYLFFGDFDKAFNVINQALLIKKKLGINNVKEAGNLAIIYEKLSEIKTALEFYEKVLTYQEDTYGVEHRWTARTLGNIAVLYKNLGDFTKSLELQKKSCEIRQKVLGREHWETAASILTLGSLYEEIESYSEAQLAYENALSILDKTQGNNHYLTISALKNLAKINYKTGNTNSAFLLIQRFIDANKKQLSGILLLDERSRLSWQEKNLNFWFASFIETSLLADVSIRNKGIILESLSEDRAMALAAGSTGEGAKILLKIKSLQAKLSKIAFEQGKEEESLNIEDEIGRLQRGLTTKYLGRDRQRISASITMSDVIPALTGGAVLVDFIQFNDPKLKHEEATCLGAIITAEDNNPVFVRIDSGAAINRAIDSLRAAINQGNAAEVEAQTKILSEKLWQPVAAKIPEVAKRLFICPDANLNFLSFAALLESDGRFVAEKYPISYIGSARDLAKKPSEKISKSMAIFANPQFDAGGKSSKSTEMVAMRSAEADAFGSIALPPLPGTETEAQSLGSLATESGWNVKSALGKDATELSVRSTKKPGVLHLATHGFYLNSFTPPAPEGSRGMSVVGINEMTEEKKKNEKGVDPMRASGVALTGAQNTLSSWSQRKAPDPETDGVITAEEVGALRLDGTWMVVLSACETGVGAARSGEGVFGLRRAFMIAGAENLLMTLWPVADETTAKIMADFYKEAFAIGDAAGSLAKVQRDWLVKLRKERGLLAAIREAGPFAMVVMTNPRGTREFVEAEMEVVPAPMKENGPKVGEIYTIAYKGNDGVSIRSSPSGDIIATAYFGPDTRLTILSEAPEPVDGLQWVQVKVDGWLAKRNLKNGDINIATLGDGTGVITWDGGGDPNDNFIAMRTLGSKGSRIAKVYYKTKVMLGESKNSGNYEWAKSSFIGWIPIRGPKGTILIDPIK
jgi:tetratricopeptide (TPR) repeat protein